jgi:hypothetical protein
VGDLVVSKHKNLLVVFAGCFAVDVEASLKDFTNCLTTGGLFIKLSYVFLLS